MFGAHFLLERIAVENYARGTCPIGVTVSELNQEVMLLAFVGERQVLRVLRFVHPCADAIPQRLSPLSLDLFTWSWLDRPVCRRGGHWAKAEPR
jgi:hypothetical protein